MQAVDDYIPTPERAIDQPFLMPIEDVFGIKGRGTVVTGRIERGLVKTGDEIEIVGMGERRKVIVTGVEMFQKTLDRAKRATMLAAAAWGGAGRTCSVGRSWRSRARSTRTPSSRPRCTCWARKRGGGTRRSSRATGRSSTSGRRT